MHPKEYLDLVDENDQVIGRKLRSEIYAEGLVNFRVINVLIINSEGKLWIPRRTPHKAIFPLGLDFSCAGHVISGDTYEKTFAKEMQEELNIDVSKINYRLLGKLTPKDGVKLFEQIYEVESDEIPNYNPDDFVEYYWLTPQEVIGKVQGGEVAKDDLVVIVKQFYS